MLSGNSGCIIVHFQNQLWGVFDYVVLSMLLEVMVGHIASARLHMTEYVFPDEVHSMAHSQPVRLCAPK